MDESTWGQEVEDSAYYDPPPGFARRDAQAYATPRRVTYASVVRGGLSDREADRVGAGVTVRAVSKANDEEGLARCDLPLNPLAPARAQGGPRYATLRQALESGGTSKGMPTLTFLSQNLGGPRVLPPATTQVSHSPPYNSQAGTRTRLPPSDGHTAQGGVEGMMRLAARGAGGKPKGDGTNWPRAWAVGDKGGGKGSQTERSLAWKEQRGRRAEGVGDPRSASGEGRKDAKRGEEGDAGRGTWIQSPAVGLHQDRRVY